MDKKIRIAIAKFKEIEQAVLNERDADDSTDAVVTAVVQLYVAECHWAYLNALVEAVDRSAGNT